LKEDSKDSPSGQEGWTLSMRKRRSDRGRGGEQNNERILHAEVIKYEKQNVLKQIPLYMLYLS
jgi:hypothetical protein